jgi:hypothetical protein
MIILICAQFKLLNNFVMLNLVQHLLCFIVKYIFMKKIADPETSSG